LILKNRKEEHVAQEVIEEPKINKLKKFPWI